MSEPLDMPDGPGWWAFEGIYPMGLAVPVQFVKRLVLWEPDDDIKVVKMQWEDNKEAHVVYYRYFSDIIRGKWYRLTMPWEVDHE
jgi:hypothetical protein